MQPQLRRRLHLTSAVAAQGSCQSLWPTLLAIVWTLLMASYWPAVLLLLSWRLESLPNPTEFVSTIGKSLGLVSQGLLFILLFIHICRPRGVGESHFGWRKQVCQLVKSSLTWYAMLAIPLGFMTRIIYVQGNVIWENSLIRFCLIAYLLITAVLAHRILSPTGPMMQPVGRQSSSAWTFRLRWLWYLLGVIIPLALIALTVVGYLYTAVQLLTRLRFTLLYMGLLIVMGGLILRWLLIRRRHLAFRELERRKQNLAEEPVPQGEETTTAQIRNETANVSPDLVSIGEQSRQLVRLFLRLAAFVGIWLIWVDVLPALGVLNRIHLWQFAVLDKIYPVTLGHLFLSIIIVAVTLLAIRDIPGLLDLLLLPRLNLDTGSRYAITAITRYSLFLIGFITAFQLLGISWSQVQWLVAAATVGLGFGLQEIFANFVSGIILLLERPVRLGDVVTVGDVTGVVSRISMRSTIITDWDRKEYVVPNKDFVTGRVLNWTLSNSILRIVIEVGVSYNSDPDKIREILLAIARENSDVLEDPSPIATFEQFGDSSLNFSLRCYLPGIDKLLSVSHRLRSAILYQFRQVGVEIPFPQRDLHIRSSPVELSLMGVNGKPAFLETKPRTPNE